MASEIVTFEDLARFHRDIVVPEIKRIVREEVSDQLAPVRQEAQAFRVAMLGHVDGIYKRFDRLEDEYQALKAGLIRVEERLTALEARVASVEERLTGVEERLTGVEERLTGVEDRLGAVEEKIDRLALKSELDELKAHVAQIEARIAQLEAQLQRSS